VRRKEKSVEPKVHSVPFTADEVFDALQRRFPERFVDAVDANAAGKVSFWRHSIKILPDSDVLLARITKEPW
jgi:hypothetical protein